MWIHINTTLPWVPLTPSLLLFFSSSLLLFFSSSPLLLFFSSSSRRRWARGSRPSLTLCRVRSRRSRPAATARRPPPHAPRRCRPPSPRQRPSPARANVRKTRRSASVCSARRNRRSLPLSFFLSLLPPPLPASLLPLSLLHRCLGSLVFVYLLSNIS